MMRVEDERTLAKVEHVKIKNITSVVDQVDLTLGKRITILIGPNNAGKSNILQILDKGLNTSSGEVIVEPEFVNEYIKSKLDIQDEPDLFDIATIESCISITENERRQAVLDTMNNLIANYRQKLPDEAVDWTSLRRTFREYCDVFFKREISLIVSILKKTDGRYYLKGHWEHFRIKWEKEIRKYEKRWKQLFMEGSHPYSGDEQLSRLISTTYYQILHRCTPLPRDLPPEKPKKVDQGGFGGAAPSPDRVREYLFFLKEHATADRGPKDAIDSIVRVVKGVFSDIDDLIPTYDITTGEAKVIVKKGEMELELGTQGDGLKHLLGFLVFMHNQEEHLLVVDEPENHLHPKLEPQIIDFFLRHGQGQLVIATHSETIVSSVPDDAIISGDVIIYGVSLDDERRTRVTRGSDSDIIPFLDSLGIQVSRYLKHMAALSQFILLVEGVSDATIIRKILYKFNKLDEFEQYHPIFVPLGGVEEASKIGKAVVDLIAKGDDTLQTPSIPFLVVLDRDENRRPNREHEFILSVREIENLVISKTSIQGVAEKFFKRIEVEFTETMQKSLHLNLSKNVQDFLNKWTLLKIRSEIGANVRPLLRRRSTGKLWNMTRGEVLNELSDEKEAIESALKEVSERYTEKYIEDICNELTSSCFSNSGELDYDYVCKNLPGKVFLKHIIPLALIETANSIKQNDADFDESTIVGMAGLMSNVNEFLAFCPEIPADIQQLVNIIEQMKKTG